MWRQTRGVVLAASEFADANEHVYLDQRVSFFHDDPRHFLRVTDGKYDLIACNTAPPMQAGVYRFYSKEFYEQSRTHLSEKGIMAQWLPTYRMPGEATDRVISTFLSVFDYVLLVFGAEDDFVLLGGQAPIDLLQIEKRFKQQQRVGTDLFGFRIHRPVSMLARIAATGDSLRRQFAGASVISDHHNDLARMTFGPQQTRAITYDPVGMLSDIGSEKLSCRNELSNIVTHLGRLSFHVQRLPVDALRIVDEAERDRYAGRL